MDCADGGLDLFAYVEKNHIPVWQHAYHFYAHDWRDLEDTDDDHIYECGREPSVQDLFRSDDIKQPEIGCFALLFGVDNQCYIKFNP